jgi:hypothetical protein
VGYIDAGDDGIDDDDGEAGGLALPDFDVDAEDSYDRLLREQAELGHRAYLLDREEQWRRRRELYSSCGMSIGRITVPIPRDPEDRPPPHVHVLSTHAGY